MNAALCKIPMSEPPEPMSRDSCATVSTPLRLFFAFRDGSRVGSAGGIREGEKSPKTLAEGRKGETLEIVQDFCPGRRAAKVDLMMDLPVGVLRTRGNFSPLSGRFHLRIAAKEKLRTAMVIICVVKDLHNTNFAAESPHSSLGTDLVDLQGGSRGEEVSAKLGEVFGKPPQSLRVAWVTSLLVAGLEKVVACNAWCEWLPAAGFG